MSAIMSLTSSCVMAVYGVAYVAMGLIMLCPPLMRWDASLGVKPALATMYPSLFKRFLLAAHDGDGKCEEDEGELGAGLARDPPELARGDLAYRLLGYLVLLLGLCRLAAALSWSCSYVVLGLVTCVGEMAFVGYELVAHESMLLHGAMAVLSELVVLSLLYIGTAIPHCRA